MVLWDARGFHSVLWDELDFYLGVLGFSRIYRGLMMLFWN